MAHTILVSDEEIRAAQEAFWQTVRIVAEAGRAPLPSLPYSREISRLPGDRVGLLVCGGNADVVDFTT